MWGLLENSKEIFMVDNMSLESAYALWKKGGLRNTMAIYAANNRPCECSNPATPDGISCFNGNHEVIRDEMRRLKIVAER